MAISPTSRYRRVTAALDERARERLWSGGDGGGDHSAGTSPELADLVDSFYGDGGDHEMGGLGGIERDDGKKMAGIEREILMGLVGSRDGEENRVLEAVEAAVRRVGIGEGEEGVKRKVVWWLRRRGFDAGLCRSKPDESNATTPFPSQSSHLYVDVLCPANTRCIVELNLAAEFEIARPTPEYLSILTAFPPVFVGRPEKLRDIVRLLCTAAAKSMRSRDMHVPPWRRREYVQGKWLGPYKRSTSLNSTNGGGKEDEVVASCRRVVVGCREGWECGGGDGFQRAVVGGKMR